jgi:GH35 family endo-1,4-beta-xylanase
MCEETDILPPDGRMVFEDARQLQLLGLGSDRMCAVEGSEVPADRVIEILVDQQGDTPWAFRLRATPNATIRAGEVVHIRFWAKNVLSDTGSARLAVIVEESAEPHAKMLDLPVTVGTIWRRIDMPAQVRRDLASGQWQVTIRLGYMRQRVQIGGLTVTVYSDPDAINQLPRWCSTYVGREHDADWRLAAAERIKAIRKGRIAVRVMDRRGMPVPDVPVQVEQIRHAFGFGTCVSTTLLSAGPDADRYRSTLLDNFNCAVVENELKWPAIDANGHDNADRIVDWLTEHRFPTRGHCLLWPSRERMPMSVLKLADDPQRFRRRIADHITSTVSRYRGRLIDWDVVNEPYAHRFAMDVLGGSDAMVEWFELAHAADPGCRLFVNDYEILASGDMLDTPHQEHYYRTIARLLERGAPIHGIGMQGHFGGNITSPHNLLKILDRFAALGLRIKVTEMDIEIADMPLRCDYYRDLLTILFSHSAVDAVMQWGFWEGSHWIPPSAIYDRSWSLRPHGAVFLDLVQNKWKTRQALSTGNDGTCEMEAFAGDYTVRAGDATIRATVEPGVSSMVTLALSR